jgi:hypothetical protein
VVPSATAAAISLAWDQAVSIRRALEHFALSVTWSSAANSVGSLSHRERDGVRGYGLTIAQ